MGALQYVHIPGYSALILRRHYTDLSLQGALMDRARAWLQGTAAKWIPADHAWRFPSGASVAFGYLATEDDKYRYRSSELHYIAFDELTDFSETQYTYLFSRLRRLARSLVPLRMRSASNPGGVGHSWVKERFIEPAKRGERRRPFIPARIADNPHLDVAAYRLSLAEMAPLDRQRIESGDWDALETGTLLQRSWFQIVDDWPREAQLVRYWDLASTAVTARNPDPDWTVGVLMAMLEGRYWLVDVQRIRGRPAEVDALMLQTATADGKEVPVRWEEEGGASGKRTSDDLQRRLFLGYDAKGIRSVGHKLLRARPFVSAAEAGNVALVRGPWNTVWLDTICLVPFGAHDDDLDAAAGALNELASQPAIRLDSIRGGGQRASASQTMQQYRL
jgi:predicted phage terminase large subunit-like protein